MRLRTLLSLRARCEMRLRTLLSHRARHLAPLCFQMVRRPLMLLQLQGTSLRLSMLRRLVVSDHQLLPCLNILMLEKVLRMEQQRNLCSLSRINVVL